MAEVFKTEREIISYYFHLGYENEVIREFLQNYHNITLSLRTLKRRLRDFGLRRNGNDIDRDQLRDIIKEQLHGSGRSLGYRAIWHSLRLEHHIHVPRRIVATVMQELDPDGVEQRRRRRLSRRRYFSYGPNFCWHVDGKFTHSSKLTVSWPDDVDGLDGTTSTADLKECPQLGQKFAASGDLDPHWQQNIIEMNRNSTI